MPRFPVNFRRKSTADEQDVAVEPSFRVLERSDYNVGKSFDGGARLSKVTGHMPRTSVTDFPGDDDNMFANLKVNRGSGGSNTTKTGSDDSSHHSNTSTAPSSTDHVAHEEARSIPRKPLNDPTVSPVQPKSSGNFLKSAGRTFSFGGKKNTLPAIPSDEPPVPSIEAGSRTPGGRSRAETTSTVTTATPPRVDDSSFVLDLGGDFTSMLSSFDKRSSVATLKGESGRPAAGSRNLTGNRMPQPAPLSIDQSSSIEPPPHSWNSQRSNEALLLGSSPSPTGQSLAPPPPPHGTSKGRSAVGSGLREKLEEDDEVSFLKDSLAASRFLSGGPSASAGSSSRYRRDESPSASYGHNLSETYSKPSRLDPKRDEDNLFDSSFTRTNRFQPRLGARSHTAPQPKVMTPAQFEQYRQDKSRQASASTNDKEASDDEDADDYEDDEDDIEKTKQLAKQRRKQEAHMTVYRQQMMKVTGEAAGNVGASRPSLSMTMSTPNLLSGNGQAGLRNPSGSNSPPSPESDEDEEVPLAILAAHGFPNKQRPPNHIHPVSSNPNMRASMAPPSSNTGNAADGRLPPFARKLPQDPYVGAGLVNQPPRESFALGGGAPAHPQGRPAHPNGLVGVIANEERSRAARRGSPALDQMNPQMNPQMHPQMPMNGGFDPMAGIPPQMMYPMGMPQPPMLTPGDQAQIQMNQQMQQFMQMQMQFMQMMAGQNQQARPQGHFATHSMEDVTRNSFLGDPMAMGMGGNGLDVPRPESHMQMRTMSMVQPSSASWIQPPNGGGYAPSIRVQGNGYAPSIAPSERSNIGLPGRYRPVSSLGNTLDNGGRTMTMSGALGVPSKLNSETRIKAVAKDDDDDDEEGWEAMKAKREKKKSAWRTKKTFGADIGALIN